MTEAEVEAEETEGREHGGTLVEKDLNFE